MKLLKLLKIQLSADLMDSCKRLTNKDGCKNEEQEQGYNNALQVVLEQINKLEKEYKRK